MTGILLVALFFVFLIGLEAPRMLKNGLHRELKVFSVFTFLAMIWAYAALVDLPLPNIVQGLDAVVRPAFLVVEGVLRAPE